MRSVETIKTFTLGIMRVLRSVVLGGSLLARSSAAFGASARLTGRRRGRSTLAMAALPTAKSEQKAFVESAWAGAEVVRPLDNGRVVVIGSSRGIGLEL